MLVPARSGPFSCTFLAHAGCTISGRLLEPLMTPIKLQTGLLVPESGIYRVIHVGHRLPHAVTICKGETFPRCAKCADLVVFELIQKVECPYSYEPLHIFELHPDEEDLASNLARAAR